MKKNNQRQKKAKLMSFDAESGFVMKPEDVEKMRENMAVIYCRVSSTKQVKEGNGLESQERKCRERCEQNNITIVEVFVEPGISGSKTDREALRKMIDYLGEKNNKYNKITHVVVSEASRLSRPDDISDALAIEAEIKSHGVDIVRLDAPNLDDSTNEGELLKTIQYAVAGYERKRIANRAMDGRRNRLLNGYRPFPQVPCGYVRKHISQKDYIDIIDEERGPIIKKGLELYADDIILTDADLWRYWDKAGLRTGVAGDKGKLQRSFVEKVMQLHRILFCAGYILYPEWGVEEVIPGVQEGLISLSCAYKIIKKQQRKEGGSQAYCSTHKMSDEHPLRGAITCPSCGRKFTSWNTSKWVGPKGNKTKKLYPYYGCNNHNCSEKVNINKDKLEAEFSDFLESVALSDGILRLIDVVFDRVWKESKSKSTAAKRRKSDAIKRREKRKNEIQQLLMKVDNIKLSKVLEEEWATLDAEIELMRDELESETHSDMVRKASLQKVKHLFEDPLALWSLGNQTMRGLLITVWFGDSLFYTKKEGLQTAGSGTLYSILSSLKENISGTWAIWDSNPGPAA